MLAVSIRRKQQVGRMNRNRWGGEGAYLIELWFDNDPLDLEGCTGRKIFNTPQFSFPLTSVLFSLLAITWRWLFRCARHLYCSRQYLTLPHVFWRIQFPRCLAPITCMPKKKMEVFGTFACYGDFQAVTHLPYSCNHAKEQHCQQRCAK